MAKEYLYVFGYEDPIDRQSNSDVHTDFETSEVIRILAEDEQQALEWGREISERFIQYLFKDNQISWKNDRFASWIENNPDEYLCKQLDSFPIVKTGQYPDFEALENGNDDAQNDS